MTGLLKKRRPYRNPAILAAAKGQPCNMESPVCSGLNCQGAAHSNLAEDGKGKGQKADDCFVCFACNACHWWYDGITWNNPKEYDRWPQSERQWYFDRAVKRTIRLLLDLGVLR